MALVEYSSDSDAAEPDSTKEHPEAAHAAKRKVAGPDGSTDPKRPRPSSGNGPLTRAQGRCSSQGSTPSKLPPLPAAFHDLYASTVRTSTVDAPSLHQGRSRQIPHVAGNWPSHIYIEWFPQPSEYELLQRLVESLRLELGGEGGELHTFLTSDLGAPLPLHISLSRPFVLKTQEKDGFLDELVESVRAAHVKPLDLDIVSLAWHRSPDSNRSFLVLRVKTRKELSSLLARSNNLVAAYGQPRLYASPDGRAEEGDAFHVSIAWSFAGPGTVEAQTAKVFESSEFKKPVTSIKVGLNAVKVKIGNIITSVELDETRSGKKRKGSLFGL
ncbi:uncharacterized protein E0L32_011723 [Thyridium curvatum]|uniref:U6 snRNA phosphodiesterase n=1 Tax=Thyridium curvatum TaxID=1093900 RepID=A0A507BNQ6_9PEZI|nr:uncharacterized protein E0L32_011723 [Thyridium curvatum]TPX18390.1 hypothetical protein E0L32_011723 [Thyridium curvatum]